jgi:RNA polymerase subunit RPABC4/transcription elongation factor Spt4
MPDDEGRWRTDERKDWKPDRPCPKCGSRNVAVKEWVNFTVSSDALGEERWRPGLLTCRDCHDRDPASNWDPFAQNE